MRHTREREAGWGGHAVLPLQPHAAADMIRAGASPHAVAGSRVQPLQPHTWISVGCTMLRPPSASCSSAFSPRDKNASGMPPSSPPSAAAAGLTAASAGTLTLVMLGLRRILVGASGRENIEKVAAGRHNIADNIGRQGREEAARDKRPKRDRHFSAIAPCVAGATTVSPTCTVCGTGEV